MKNLSLKKIVLLILVVIFFIFIVYGYFLRTKDIECSKQKYPSCNNGCIKTVVVAGDSLKIFPNTSFNVCRVDNDLYTKNIRFPFSEYFKKQKPQRVEDKIISDVNIKDVDEQWNYFNDTVIEDEIINEIIRNNKKYFSSDFYDLFQEKEIIQKDKENIKLIASLSFKFSPQKTKIAYYAECWEGMCTLFIKDTNTLKTLREYNVPKGDDECPRCLDYRHTGIKFNKWINEDEIEYGTYPINDSKEIKVFKDKILEKTDSENKKRMTVKIPKWEFLEKDNDFKVDFFKYEVPYTKAILGATLKKLFELRGGDENGNWNGMSFNSVSLKDGKAIIKLKGKWYPAGDMSGAYMAHEINAATFQFSTVKSLEVWLNGKIFDWCWDDLSGGEGGCPEKKMLWIKQK